MSRLSIKNNPLVLAVLAVACLLGNATAGAAELQGSALRPTPLLMPLDYTAARAQAWLAALDKALDFAAHSVKKDTWYDRTLTFLSDTAQAQ